MTATSGAYCETSLSPICADMGGSLRNGMGAEDRVLGQLGEA